MPEVLRVCLFSDPDSGDSPFRAPFEQINNLVVVGESFSWEDIRDWLTHGGVDVVAVNLDESDGHGLDIVQRISQLSPMCAIIGISQRADPESIIGAMRVGCNQFVRWPVDMKDLTNAIDRIRATRPATAGVAKQICVIGSSGGAGATTIACALAMELAQIARNQVALVDMNLEFGDVACAFDCHPRFSVADVCGGGAEVDTTLVRDALHSLPCNVSILARPERIGDAHHVTHEGVEAMFKVLADMFPYVIVDLPRAYSFLSALSLKEANRVLIVTQLGVSGVRNATRIYECLLQMETDENNIEIVINRCKGELDRLSPKDVEVHFNRPIFAMIPNDYRHVQNALDLGHPIASGAPRSPVHRAIQRMARQLVGDHETDTLEESNAGFMSRLWRRPAKAGRA